MDNKEVVNLILQRVEKAEIKYPVWPEDIIHAASIVFAEAGELSEAALDETYNYGKDCDAFEEALDTAATAFRFIKNYKGR